MSNQTYYTLSNGQKIPAVGFGTWQTPDRETAITAVKTALKAGYRHIDTAAIYGNEKSVGQGIKESGIPREELFITTKLWNNAYSYEAAKEAIDESLAKLDCGYFDLYLIHWPAPKAIRDTWKDANAGAWKAMEEAVDAGKIKSIGVSNFMPHHLDSLLETAKIKPVVNQIFLNPSDQQQEVVAHNKKHNILSQAYSPLGTGTIFEVEALKEMAAKYGKSVAQLAIRWSLQKGFNPLPKSVTEARIIENFQVFDFEISTADMAKIDDVAGLAGEAKNPDEVNF